MVFQDREIERTTAAMQIGIRLILTTTPWFKSPGVSFFLWWNIEYSLWWNIEYILFTNLAQCKDESQLRAASWYKKALVELLVIGDSSHTQPWVPPHLSMPPTTPFSSKSSTIKREEGAQPCHTESNKWTFLMLCKFPFFLSLLYARTSPS